MKRMKYRSGHQRGSIGGVLDYAKLAQLCVKPDVDPLERRSLAATGDEAVQLHVEAWPASTTRTIPST